MQPNKDVEARAGSATPGSTSNQWPVQSSSSVLRRGRKSVLPPPISTLGNVGLFALCGTGCQIAREVAGSVQWQLAFGSLAVVAFGMASLLFVTWGERLRTALSRLQLTSLFCLAYIGVFGLVPLVWLLFNQDNTSLSGIELHVVAAASSILVGFIVVFALGNRAVPERLVGSISRFSGAVLGNENESSRVPMFLLLVSWTASAYLWATNSLGYITDASEGVTSARPFGFVISSLSSLSTVAIFWMAWKWAKSRVGPALALLLIAVVVDVAVGLASGMKSSAVAPLLAAVLGLWGGGRAFPWKLCAVSILGLVFVVAPLVNNYRSLVNLGDGSRIRTSQIVETLGVAAASSGASGTASSVTSLLDREMLVQEVAVINQLVPSVIAYKSISELIVSPLYGIVPRAIWTDKPLLTTGRDYAVEVRGQSLTTYSSRAVTLPGDLWRHGGWPVLIVGAFLLGGILRLVDALSVDGRDARYFFVFALLVESVRQEQDAVTFVAAIPAAVALGLAAGWLAKCNVKLAIARSQPGTK